MKDQKKVDQFEIKTINSIDDIAKFYGIKKDKIKTQLEKIDKKIKIYDSRYIYYKDAIRVLNHLKLSYILNSQLTVIEDIQSNWVIQEKKHEFTTVGIMGHINHGKTTLIEKIINTKIIEDDNITQNISVYKNKHLYLIDTPGHELFHRFREHILNVIDVIILVISLEDGIANETKKIISLIIERGLNEHTVVLFTKADIAKHTSDSLIEKLENMGLYTKYIVLDLKEDVYTQVYNLVKDFKSKNNNLYNHLVTIKSTNKTFNLLKLEFGEINKKTMILCSNDLYRVTGIYNLQFDSIVSAMSPCFVYVTTDRKMDINDTYFVQTDSIQQAEYYNKYVLGIRYKDSFNKIDNQAVYNKKKIVCIIEDIILFNIISTMSQKHNLDKILIIIFKSDKHIINTIEPTQQVILFRISDDKEIKSILSDIGAVYTEFTNIYQLDDYFAKNNLDIFNNITIHNLAQVVKIFTINNKKIIGCKMLKGSFKMNQKISIAKSAQINEQDESNTIISMKQDTKFIKQTKKDIFFGVVFSNLSMQIEENYYIYN